MGLVKMVEEILWYLTKFVIVFIIIAVFLGWIVGSFMLLATGKYIWAAVLFVGGIAAVTATKD